jgi:uncharacterized protein (DUF2336 family)
LVNALRIICTFSVTVNGHQAIMSDQSPAFLPFLASLAMAESAESRRILLRITTDQFISRQDHSPAQLAKFEKTLLRLIARSDPPTRLIVARKLARHPLTPAAALEMIEEMGGEGALHVLECAPLPRDRLAGAASGNESRACALARRSDLDAELVTRLSLRPESDVVLALAGNQDAPIDAPTFAALARRAEREKPLAEALLGRAPGSVDPTSLFLLASSEQRALLLAAAQRMEFARANAASPRPDHSDSIARLELYALEREPELFIEVLAQSLGCSRDLGERIAKEPSGEPLAVALAALDAPQDVAVRILISGDLQSGAKYTRIGSLIRLRDGLHPAAARRVIAALVGAQKEPRALHQPILDPQASATPSRPAAATAPRAMSASPEALRRQRAFAFAAAHQSVQRSG